MKIPKYIKKALDDRVKAADKFNDSDNTLSEYITKYNIEVEMYDYAGGVEAIVNPDASAERIRKAILNK